MSENKKGRSIGSRLTALILFMAATLITITVMAGYHNKAKKPGRDCYVVCPEEL